MTVIAIGLAMGSRVAYRHDREHPHIGQLEYAADAWRTVFSLRCCRRPGLAVRARQAGLPDARELLAAALRSAQRQAARAGSRPAARTSSSETRAAAAAAAASTTVARWKAGSAPSPAA